MFTKNYVYFNVIMVDIMLYEAFKTRVRKARRPAGHIVTRQITFGRNA